MPLDETQKEEDVIKRITNANYNNEPWFEIKVIIPYEDDEKDVVVALQINLEKMLTEGIQLMYSEIKNDFPKIIVPN